MRWKTVPQTSGCDRKSFVVEAERSRRLTSVLLSTWFVTYKGTLVPDHVDVCTSKQRYWLLRSISRKARHQCYWWNFVEAEFLAVIVW